MVFPFETAVVRLQVPCFGIDHSPYPACHHAFVQRHDGNAGKRPSDSESMMMKLRILLRQIFLHAMVIIIVIRFTASLRSAGIKSEYFIHRVYLASARPMAQHNHSLVQEIRRLGGSGEDRFGTRKRS